MVEKGARKIRTVEHTVEIIETIDRFGSIGVTELAAEIGMSKGGVHTQLATLRDNNYVVKDGDEYRLSYKFLEKANNMVVRKPVFRASYEEMEKLADDTDEHVLLMVEEFGKGVNIHKVRGKRGVAQDYISRKIGIPVHLHLNAPGKAILAHLPERRREEIIERHGLPAKTENTITDVDELNEELERIRDQRYAINDEEEDYGLRAVAAPIIDEVEDKQVRGAITVSGPISRLSGEVVRGELAERVIEAANIAEINLRKEIEH